MKYFNIYGRNFPTRSMERKLVLLSVSYPSANEYVKSKNNIAETSFALGHETDNRQIL